MNRPVSSRVDRYWAQFLDSIPPSQPKPDRYVEAFFFGTIPDRAHEISRLVLDGTKTATGSLLGSLEADGKRPPRAGDYWVVTNGADDPVCIIQTTDARLIAFDEVGGEYAWWGGERERNLESWRTHTRAQSGTGDGALRGSVRGASSDTVGKRRWYAFARS
jgi:uncharacterized protein YhfF